jgi:class 3 adenylate cyclase
VSADPSDTSGLREQIAENQQAIDRLNRDLARKSNEVRIIQQISSEITSTLDLDVLAFAHSMILLKDVADNVLRVAATRGYAEQGAGAQVRLGEGVIGVVGERRRMMRIGNIGASMRYLKTVRARMESSGEVGPAEAPAVLPGLTDVQSQLALPLTVKDRLVGVLAVESRTPNAFDELDEVLLRIVGNQAATAIDNARTYQIVEQLGRLKRFFSPQLADLIIRGGADDPLKTHRREVTVVFLDLRGFTAFAETSEPEEVMGVLHEYHGEMGRLILAHEGTLERFTGDGMMIFFNDPLPMPDAAERAVRMAVAMRDRAAELAVRWHRKGYELDLGIGIAKGFATIGAIGFEGRWDYGAIGTVTNLAARLCGEAKPGQILISPRLLPEVENLLEVEEMGLLAVKGLARPVKPLNVLRLRDPA